MFRVHMRSDGPYLFRRELFDPDLLVPDTFFLNFEFPIRSLRQGVRHTVVQIPCAAPPLGPQQEHGLEAGGRGRPRSALAPAPASPSPLGGTKKSRIIEDSGPQG